MFVLFVLCCSILSFSITGLAAEKSVVSVSDSKYPITVEAERTDAFDNQEKIPIDEITIKENSKDAFSANQKFIFCVQNKPFAVDVGVSFNMLFSPNENKTVENDTIKAMYNVENGNLIVTIKESNPNKIESLVLTNLMLKQNTDRVVLRTYSLYECSDTELVPVVTDFVEVEEYKEYVDKENLEIVIKVNNGTLLVNGDEKSLRVPAYISNAGYTMLPIREVTEVFPGTKILWDNENKEASILYGPQYVSIKSGATEMYINGEENILRNKAEVKDGRMFVSLRDMCRICNIPSEDIIWDNTTKTVYITTEVQK